MKKLVYSFLFIFFMTSVTTVNATQEIDSLKNRLKGSKLDIINRIETLNRLAELASSTYLKKRSDYNNELLSRF